MTKPVSIVFYSGFAIIFLGILAPLFVEMAKPAPKLPKLGSAPQFELIDSENETFSTQTLDKSVWVTNFFFSRCEGPCPVQSAHIASLSQRFANTPSVRVLSVSVDSEHDTPEVLNEYAKRFAADTSKWHFLTGEKEKVVSLLNDGFRLGSPKETRYHSTRFVLVDSKGEIRGYYDGTDPEMVKKLATHIKHLVP